MTYNDLEKQISEITGLLLTHPQEQDHRASEIWIKFRKKGFYVFFDFEQPFPKVIITQKLVGAGDALDCSEYKKNKLTQYNEKSKVLDILDESLNFRGNNNDTIGQITKLVSSIKTPYLYK